MPADFRGGSVRICGSRVTPADSQYRCDSTLPSAPCSCYDFDATGTVPSDMGGTLVIPSLCASTIVPASSWRFEYQIYDGTQCTGRELTGPDFTCYSTRDLVTKANPNGAVETLPQGNYTNHVLCIATTMVAESRGACVLVTSDDDRALGQTRYGCGCVLTNGACACASAVPALSALDSDCEIDAASCEIVCNTPRLFACDDSKYIMTGEPSTLMILDTVSLRLVPLGTALELLGALGSRERDGFLYAVTQRSGEPQHLIRIRRDGTFSDVGPIAGLSGRVSAGSFFPDGSYVVYANDLGVFVVVDVDTATAISSIVPQTTDDYSNLAVNPVDGQLWTYAPSTQAIGTFSLDTGEFSPLCPLLTADSTADAEVTVEPSALLFDRTGKLLVYGAAALRDAGEVGDARAGLYSLDLTTNELTLLGLVPEVSHANGTSCSLPTLP